MDFITFPTKYNYNHCYFLGVLFDENKWITCCFQSLNHGGFSFIFNNSHVVLSSQLCNFSVHIQFNKYIQIFSAMQEMETYKRNLKHGYVFISVIVFVEK